MKRREFIGLVGGAAAWPLSARAQQQAVPVIGFLSYLSRDDIADRLQAFARGLSEMGYVEGQTVTIDFRSANEHYEQFPAMAAELVQRRVNIIVANTNAAATCGESSDHGYSNRILHWLRPSPGRTC